LSLITGQRVDAARVEQRENHPREAAEFYIEGEENGRELDGEASLASWCSEGMAQMTDVNGTETGIQVNKGLLLASALLLGGGAVLGATGMLLGAASVISAARQWINQLERQPVDIARSRWQQVRAAGNAAANAWQNQAEPSRP
jgi:hypothetical protein